MKTSFTIFLVFFGAAVLDALTSHNLLRIGFWLAIALLFLAAEWLGERRAARRREPVSGAKA